jgi:hypothetical protein
VVIKQFAPSPALAPFIRAYEIIETQDAVMSPVTPARRAGRCQRTVNKRYQTLIPFAERRCLVPATEVSRA